MPRLAAVCPADRASKRGVAKSGAGRFALAYSKVLHLKSTGRACSEHMTGLSSRPLRTPSTRSLAEVYRRTLPESAASHPQHLLHARRPSSFAVSRAFPRDLSCCAQARHLRGLCRRASGIGPAACFETCQKCREYCPAAASLFGTGRRASQVCTRAQHRLVLELGFSHLKPCPISRSCSGLSRAHGFVVVRRVALQQVFWPATSRSRAFELEAEEEDPAQP